MTEMTGPTKKEYKIGPIHCDFCKQEFHAKNTDVIGYEPYMMKKHVGGFIEAISDRPQGPPTEVKRYPIVRCPNCGAKCRWEDGEQYKDLTIAGYYELNPDRVDKDDDSKVESLVHEIDKMKKEIKRLKKTA